MNTLRRATPTDSSSSACTERARGRAPDAEAVRLGRYSSISVRDEPRQVISPSSESREYGAFIRGNEISVTG
jgi:hypothetical protein